MTPPETVKLLAGCVDDRCIATAVRWADWSDRVFGEHLLPAMIDVSADYQQHVGAKGRNMIRKAEKRGYRYGYFLYNDHLDEMHEINTSMPERGGLAMTDSYHDRPEPIANSVQCRSHGTFYIGGAKNGKLMAYCYLSVCGELAVINRFIGHGAALQDGVMSGLVNHLVTAAREHGARWLNYLTMESRTVGLESFKKNVGFRGTPLVFAL